MTNFELELNLICVKLAPLMRGLFAIVLLFFSSVLPLMAQSPTEAAPKTYVPAPLSDELLAVDLEAVEGKPSGSKDLPQAPLVEREYTRVAVLGYHNFSKTEPVTQMLMRTDEFRQQMEYIRKTGLTVISMQEFLDWRFGVRKLPAQCVLITLDDGWRSVYTEAFPILKEYGYPFTLFLYTDFISGRGMSLSPKMVKEMQSCGATVGSHSKSHPYPSEWQKALDAGVAAMQEKCKIEIAGSQRKLESLFGKVQTYCYPGGFVNAHMLDCLQQHGYVAAFTVVPAKVTSTEDPLQIRRYMIFGNDSSIFDAAMDFRVKASKGTISTGFEPGTLPPSTPLPSFPVSPSPNTIVACDFPMVSLDMGRVAGVDFSTLRMRVSGFGMVPAKVDSIARRVEWVPPFSIYMPNISVHVTWKTLDGASHKAEWSFRTDWRVAVD